MSGGQMDFCGRFVKYSLFVTNFVIFLVGAILFGLGIYTLVDKSYMNALLGTNLYIGAVYVLIATSLIVCLLSFFGCMGAAKEIKCMLLTYFTLLFLIFVVILIGGILGYVFREKVLTTMQQEMESSLKFYGNNRDITYAWDTTQEQLKCCGIVDYRSWTRTGFLPPSCCKPTGAYGEKAPCSTPFNPSLAYTRGCLQVTTEFIRDHAAIIAGSSIFLAVLLMLGMIFSCSLFKIIEYY